MEEVIHICYVNYIVNEQNIISTNQRENKSTNMLRWYGRPVDITVDKSMNLYISFYSTSQYGGVSYLLNVFNFGVKSVENHIESIFCNSLFGCFLFGREDTFPLFLSKIWCRFYDFLTITVKVHMPYTS